MNRFSETWRRWRSIGRRADIEHRLDDELQFHVDQQTAKNVRAGMAPDEARRQALVQFGAMARTKEATRDEFRASHIEDLMRDARYAVRALWRVPGFTIVAIVTLALGIGANTALFSIADAVLLRPLAYPEPDRLVWIDGAPLLSGEASFDGLAAEFHESPMFEDGGLFASGALNVGGEGSAERVRAASVTAGFLTALRAVPAAGRTFTEEDVRSRARVAVVGDELARRRGLAPASMLALNGRDFTVIGVMPPGADFPDKSALWIPMGSDFQATGNVLAPFTLARLAPGVTPDLAVAEIDRIKEQRDGRPRDPQGVPPRVVPLADFLTGAVRPLLLGVLAAVGLVLLAACVNTTNLLLARMSARRREMSVRRALGASRWRLTRHLLLESVVLVSVAALAALPIAMWTLDAIVHLLPATLHTSGEIAIDRRALAATAAVCALATMIVGVAPALSLRRAADEGALHRSSSPIADAFWRRTRSGLVVFEMAIAIVLIAGAVTLVNTAGRLMRVDLGVRGERVLTAETLPLARYDSAERVVGFHDRVDAAFAALPGVEAAGATSVLPGAREFSIASTVVVDGLPVPAGSDRRAIATSVTPGYFRAIGIDLLAGRHFTAEDCDGAPRVAIVSARVARLVGLEPHGIVGRRIQVFVEGGRDWATVVGVVGDVAIRGPEAGAVAQLYRPMAQAPAYGTTFFAVKTTTPPAGLAPALREAIASIDGALPLYSVRTFDEVRAAFVSDRRFAMTVMNAFGLFVTLLAGIGLYGVLTYIVQLRTREIGIHMALGASPGSVRWHVVRSGLVLGGGGLVLGSIAAYGASQVLVSRIPGIEAAGAGLVVAAAFSMLVLTAIVAWLPARRATRINPILALRVEE